MIERLAAMPGTAVVSATADVPEWVPERVRQQVLTPAEAKGLEYHQTVCVIELDGACALAAVGTIAYADARLNEEMRRNAIDQARVALTRATDTLVLLDDEASWKTTPMKETAVDYSAADLIEHLTDDAATPHERAVSLAEECRALREENMERALVRGRQALELLGRGNEMGKVTEPAICRMVSDTVLATVAAGLLDEEWDEAKRGDAMALGAAAIERKSPVCDEDGKSVYDEGDDETARREKDEATTRAMVESELLQALADMQNKDLNGATGTADLVALLRGHDGTRTWADAAIGRHKARFAGDICAAANTIAAMDYRKPIVELWLRAIGVEDAAGEAERLAVKAFDWLTRPQLRRGKNDEQERVLNAAEAILATLPEDPLREGRIEESEARPAEALKLYRKAGSAENIQRVIAENALWEEAGRHARRDRADRPAVAARARGARRTDARGNGEPAEHGRCRTAARGEHQEGVRGAGATAAQERAFTYSE
ncbi:MAG: hypothetical protein OXG04_15990 [Acidobacteria bacterium]|nr:hypothetical protein [Acidobacteriota bacterium]